MQNVCHLLNVIDKLSSNSAPEIIALRSYYIERCRRLKNDDDLPKRIFGPEEMCPYCGSVWSKIDNRFRIRRGKKMGKSVKKLIAIKNCDKKKLSKIKKTLLKKATKNFNNKATIKCSVCSKTTVVEFKKPKRLKSELVDSCKKNSNENNTLLIKKRKKRTKDKTAGLIITSNNNQISKESLKTTIKPKGTNLSKLSAVIKKKLTPSKKSALHDFISELG